MVIRRTYLWSAMCVAFPPPPLPTNIYTLKSQDDFEAWKFILGNVAAQLCPSGRPRFLDDPDNSVLRLCRPESYTKGNTKVLQKIYGRQSIVVPRFSDYRAEWSLDELEFAGDPKQDTSMQGQCCLYFVGSFLTSFQTSASRSYQVTTTIAW